MLIPAMMPLQMDMSQPHMHAMPASHSLWIASLAVAVHTLAMLIVTAPLPSLSMSG